MGTRGSSGEDGSSGADGRDAHTTVGMRLAPLNRARENHCNGPSYVHFTTITTLRKNERTLEGGGRAGLEGNRVSLALP